LLEWSAKIGLEAFYPTIYQKHFPKRVCCHLGPAQASRHFAAA
jgi:hypothetical protein